MIVFTSIGLNYLPKARILNKTLKKHHPDWEVHLLVSDRIDYGLEKYLLEPLEEFDKVFFLDDLEIPDKAEWIKKHNIVELCTAVKGPYLKKLVLEGADKIMYIDPDIAVINGLSPLESLLDNYSILLTPHLVTPPTRTNSILDNEIAGCMRHGIFNLGFLAINGKHEQGKEFAEWWNNRLIDYCYADYEKGLFTDQKWCDFVPAYFSNLKIVSDPGYNVASWNLDCRVLSYSENGQILVNSEFPLRFYHFTGYDSGAGLSVMQSHFGEKSGDVPMDLWEWYERMLEYYKIDELQGRKWNLASN